MRSEAFFGLLEPLRAIPLLNSLNITETPLSRIMCSGSFCMYIFRANFQSTSHKASFTTLALKKEDRNRVFQVVGYWEELYP